MKKNKSKIFFSQKIVHPKGLGNWVDLYNQPFRPSSVTENRPMQFDGQPTKTLTQLNEIHSLFFQKYAKQINSKLNTDNELSDNSLHHIETQSAQDIIKEAPLLLECKLRSIGSVVVAVPIQTCSMVLNKVFGTSTRTKKTLTSLEKKLIIHQFSFIPSLLTQQWNHIFTLEDIEIIQHTDTQPEFKTSNQDPIISLFTGNFTNKSNTNSIHLIYPNALIKSLHKFYSQKSKETNGISLSKKTM